MPPLTNSVIGRIHCCRSGVIPLADNSAIEWTTATWNWATGCTKISDGCQNCYMFREYPRLKRFGLQTYKWAPDQVHIHEEVLGKPFEWKSHKMIFTNSMSDFFHERISFEFLDRVIEVIRSTPQHTYQVLTKRSWRMMRYGARIGTFPENLWLGITVESAPYKFRIEHLKKTRANVRFISIEPLIESVGKLDLSSIDWVIVGGESGPHCRPCLGDWVREVRDQCIAENVAFFFKQWGGFRPKSGGRRLDGREWNEFPRPTESSPMIIVR
ncbi:MAG: phage Gp37/Gp68 family protein [Candidatus Bathyarchaeia archaeon]